MSGTGTRVAVTGFACETVEEPDGRTDAEILGPVVDRALADSGFDAADVGVVVSASSEFLTGVIGTVMGAFDALPGWPPRAHSHLDGDGAFALHECWVRLLAGEARVGLVCAFSRPLAEGDRRSMLRFQLDPYTVAPLAPDATSLAALQARALVDSGRYTEADIAAVTSARRGGPSTGELLGRPYTCPPLREADRSTVCSGAAAVVLATEEAAHRSRRPPAWIAGVEQRIERHYLGHRDLTASRSTAEAARCLGLTGTRIDVLEMHTPFAHQELVLLDSITADVGSTSPSGGGLAADPMMATGLIRIGSAADAVMSGRATRAVGHATNGPCLQQNLLCLLEAGEP